MLKKIIRTLCLLIVFALVVGAAVYGVNAFITRQEEIAERQRQAEIAAFYARPDIILTVTEDTISQLDQYTNLHSVDLTGSTCYEAIEQFIATHPNVSVTYTVDLSGRTLTNDTTELTLEADTFDYDALHAAISHLPALTRISLPCTTLSPAQIAALRSDFSNVDIEYTFTLLGQELNEAVTELDLSEMTPSQIPELSDALPMLPHLTTIELMKPDGSSNFSMTDVKQVMDACPDVQVLYTFKLFGKTLTTTTQTVEYEQQDIGNSGEEQIRQALAIMPSCSYFKLDDCGIDSEVMASIRSDFPNTKVVWRVFFGKFNCLTDSEMLRLTFGLTDDIIEELKYCNDVKYLDAGHDEELTDISFVSYMPKLEICILSGSPVSDLSAFQDHQNIEFLELCFCSYIKDLTPLANCTNLKYLNVSATSVKDLTPLDNLPLERFNCMMTKVNSTEQNRFLGIHPSSDCLTRFSGKQPYGYGWRYVDNGVTFWDYYANMRVIFDYENVNYYSGKEYTKD